MDVFENHKVDISRAVLVDSVTGSEADEEVIEFLKRYGSINRTITIEDKTSAYYQNFVVEFKSQTAVDALYPQLPYTFTATKDVNFEITALSDVYTEEVGTTKTQTYLTELKHLAKATGKDFAQVLQEMMVQIGGTIADLQPATVSLKESPEAAVETQKASLASLSKAPPTAANSAEFTSPPPQPQVRHSLSASDLNPPDVQRYVVEHIVKTDDHSSHALSSQKLRVFSGKVPRPAHESDYDTWRSSVDLIMKDPAISDLIRSRKILESLLPPAADVVKHLSSETAPDVYLQQLDSAYGAVQDGDELFAKFMDTFQDSGGLPSAYLQRLQVSLNLAVKRGGVQDTEVNKHLLNQFCRGCWDNTLISELQLTQKKSKPPSFSDLLWLLRTEEDRKAAKAVRMRQHLGVKQKAAVNLQVTEVGNEPDPVAALTTLTQQLAQQMADMQKQLAALTSQSHQNKLPSPYTGSKNPKSKSSKSASMGGATAPKPGYCFQCGEDGHTRPQCQNPPNPKCVADQREKFNKKLQAWKNQNQSKDPLN